jgi:hypothetical protein
MALERMHTHTAVRVHDRGAGAGGRTSPRRLPSASPSDTAAMDTASTRLLHSLAVVPAPLSPPERHEGGSQLTRSRWFRGLLLPLQHRPHLAGGAGAQHGR